MRKYILSMAAAVSLGAATPAMAYDSGSLLSMQEALGVAFEVGIAAVSDAEFAGHEWQIEGRDSKAATQPASIWKSTSMPRRARCSTSTDQYH
jgi:hypothetical protein